MPKQKKQKQHPKKAEEDSLYVGVKEPNAIRQNLIESSKDLMKYTEMSDKLKTIREDKRAELSRLREIIREINRNTNKLRSYLPKTKLKGLAVKKEEKKQKKKAKMEKPKKSEMEAPPAPKERKDSELERLEKELSEIEGRLSKLT